MGNKNLFPRADRLLRGNISKINPYLPMEDQTELIPYDKRWEFPEHRLRLGTFKITNISCLI